MEPQPKPISERSRLRRFINRYEVDQAVFFAITSRAWSFLSGPITMLLIATLFTEEMQDYFYIFWFLLGMQTFFELSMDVVIVNLASHEWVSLKFAKDGTIEGDDRARRRLSSLRQITRRWYRIASVVFLLAVGIGGIWFLGRREPGAMDESQWLMPWIALAVLSSLQLNLLPAVGLLEGCGQLGFINRVRTVQAVIGSLAMWAAVASGAGLWAIVAIATVRLTWDLWLVFVRYAGFFGSLSNPSDLGALTWRDEIWPLQWRLGVQSFVIYFSLNMFSAVMFEYHPKGLAGQMGLTWSIITTIQRSAFAWVETRRPMFGGLIAERRFERLDEVFWRLSVISVVVLFSGCVVFVLGLLAINNLDFWITNRLSERMLGLPTTIVLCLAVLVFQVSRCQTIYVRAHKKDPFLIPLTLAHLANVILIWQLGKYFGAMGAACGFLVSVLCLFFPIVWRIWFVSRRDWHADPSVLPETSR
ncbi:MAG: hypothetical protein AB8G99_16990 [Planctomycetaceae bacterium]